MNNFQIILQTMRLYTNDMKLFQNKLITVAVRFIFYSQAKNCLVIEKITISL